MPKVICDPPALPSALPTANPLFLEGYQIKGGSEGGANMADEDGGPVAPSAVIYLAHKKDGVNFGNPA